MLKNNTKSARKIILGMLIAFCSVHLTAQEEATEPKKVTISDALNKENIEGQFDILIKKSGRFQEYKVVKRVFIDKLKKNTLDSIKVFESKIASTNTLLEEQKATIEKLEKSLATTDQNLASVTQEKDSMNFMGIPFSKSGYKSLMWGISGLLLALLLFFIFKFKNSNVVTVAAKKSLAETEAEFEEHRRKALEREQKLNRKLQDEVNKQRNKTV